MAKVDVKNISGKSVGSIDLDDSVFGAEVHEHLLWEVVKWQLAKRRQGTASTKRLGEVRGSTKKMWKQKGTGQARSGSRRAPHWVGGASVFGPKPRDYGRKVSKTVKRIALRKALSERIKAGDVLVIDHFAVEAPKTRQFVAALDAITPEEKVLIIASSFDENTFRAARNVQPTRLITAAEVNTEQLLAFKKIVVTNDALAQLAERMLSKER